jgi:hypothetical protein
MTKNAKSQPIEIKCLRGADEICDFVKEDKKCINELVKNEGLPAWKRGESGIWRALNVDLQSWLIQQRNKYLKDTPKYM